MASAHIVTAVIGSGVLSLAWATAQLGWIVGPIVLFMFAVVTYFTSTLLASCYRSGDPNTGKRNYTYMDAVRSNLGGFQVKLCGIIQYVNLFGIVTGYTIASATSMMGIKKSILILHGERIPDHMSGTPYIFLFGVIQLFLSQIPNFDQISWLSIVAAVMSFTYSSIGLVLGIAKVAANGHIKGSLTGIRVGPTVTESQKIWRSFQALGDIAFAYSFSVILLEIQDTIKSPPSESKTMKKSALISVSITTIFYMLCGCFGYAAFGDLAPPNLITGDGNVGFHKPYWLIDIANVAIVVHLVGAYQVFSQPLFAFVEKSALKRFPGNSFIAKEMKIGNLKLNLLRLVWRSMFVVLTTGVAVGLPFFNDIVGLFGAFAFWPLTVNFPIQMYIAKKRIPKWSMRWVCFQVLSLGCLLISLAAAVGSIVGVLKDLKHSN
ncbi:amino acid permease 3-like [Impatiens glandulifera]|uniref:amino acid permease 3-like n=1 Tax=Impatiens glandulifera TaxID=253017 RepID=UPI001FB0CF68|nr:amino acid permease 3-like [Impatiens glandulifera]